MLLDEWSDQELELAKAIGGERGSAVRRTEDPIGLLDGVHGLDGLEGLDSLNRLDGLDGLGDEIAIEGALGATLARADTQGTDDHETSPRPEWDRPAPGDGNGVAIALDLKPCGGDGLVLSLQIEGQRARAWVDGQAWCEWLAPRLAVQRVQQIPPDLVALLGHWALLSLESHAARAGLGAPRFVAIEPGSCARAIAPTLSLMRSDAVLDLRLLDWPEPWIASLAETMEDRRPRLSIPPIPVALAAGWTQLSRSQLAGLAPGDGIVLDHASAVEHGQAWLIAERPLARLRFDRGAWCVEHVYHKDHNMQEIADAMLKGDPFGDDNIVLTAVAEVGRLSMSLDMLRELQTGQVLELAHATRGRVTLTVSGQIVASGALLRVGDKLVMRIE